MSYVPGQVTADIPVRNLWDSDGNPRVINDPNTTLNTQPWDLDYRINVATNAFNKLHDWVHAPAARGETGPLEWLTKGFIDEHWKNNERPPIRRRSSGT